MEADEGGSDPGRNDSTCIATAADGGFSIECSRPCADLDGGGCVSTCSGMLLP